MLSLKIEPMRLKDLPHKTLHSSKLLNDVYVKVRFATEIQLIKGTHRNSCTHPSIIHFSMNRAASQFVKRLLCRCAKANGMTPVHLNEFARATELPFFDHMPAEQFQAYRQAFKPVGYCYSAFGGFVRGIEDLDRYLVVLVLRDPRDMLTSRYYSTAFSHSLPTNPSKAAEFVEFRNQVRSMTVDEFVLKEKDHYCQRYRVYIEELENRKNVHVTKYEDMIGDFETWFDGLLSFCALKIGDDERKRLIDETTKSQKPSENQKKHKRQVIPGDHRRKLKPETISALNADLGDILSRYGYA